MAASRDADFDAELRRLTKPAQSGKSADIYSPLDQPLGLWRGFVFRIGFSQRTNRDVAVSRSSLASRLRATPPCNQSMLTTFIGIDASWKAGNPSGVAVARGTPSEATLSALIYAQTHDDVFGTREDGYIVVPRRRNSTQ